MKPKPLDEIRPATKGVKLKPRRRPKRKQEVQDFRRPDPPKARVERDVMPPPPPSEPLPSPTPEAMAVAAKSKRAGERLRETMAAVNRLMNIRVLASNRSVKEQEEERRVVKELAQAAVGVEALVPGEGILGMATLAVRQGLALRDAGNELAYQVHLLEEKVARLSAKLEEKDGKGEAGS